MQTKCFLIIAITSMQMNKRTAIVTGMFKYARYAHILCNRLYLTYHDDSLVEYLR